MFSNQSKELSYEQIWIWHVQPRATQKLVPVLKTFSVSPQLPMLTITLEFLHLLGVLAKSNWKHIQVCYQI